MDAWIVGEMTKFVDVDGKMFFVCLSCLYVHLSACLCLSTRWVGKFYTPKVF